MRSSLSSAELWCTYRLAQSRARFLFALPNPPERFSTAAEVRTERVGAQSVLCPLMGIQCGQVAGAAIVLARDESGRAVQVRRHIAPSRTVQ